MALTEVNANYLWESLVDGVDAEPQLNFWRHLGWEIVENTLVEETEAGRVDGRWTRARRGAL